MTKKELRKKYKKRRDDLSLEAIQDLSLQIANRCLELPIWHYENYHIFLTIEEHKEVQTDALLHILSGKDKNIILSRSEFDTLKMTNVLLTDNVVIKKNHWNIPEPQNGIIIDNQIIDVVFVPLLAYDQSGNRVGYGKGFYDIFLSECKLETLKIGLSFFDPESNIKEAEAHDIRLDYCITPENSYIFTPTIDKKNTK